MTILEHIDLLEGQNVPKDMEVLKNVQDQLISQYPHREDYIKHFMKKLVERSYDGRKLDSDVLKKYLVMLNNKLK